MSEKKYPRVIVGAFIFNEKDELFLMKTVQWKGLYTCPGGKVELDETVIEAVEREVKEETNMDTKDIEFVSVSEGLKLIDNYTKPENHLIFLNYKVTVKNTKKIKLNEEATEYKWKKVEDWLGGDNIVPTAREFLQKEYIDKNDEDLEHKYKRALADYQNLLKQVVKEKSEFAKYANEQLLHEIIPVYDNLKMALDHSDENNHDQWLEGIKHVLNQFKNILESIGVEEIKTKDEKFDHNTMDAVDGKGKKVKKEVKPGYKLNGKVIIPAKVILE